MDLVDDKDDIAALTDFLNKALHAAFKLAPELSARHQSGEVQQEYFLIPKLEGHIALGDPLGQALGNGGLAHAGLTDEAGIVLLTAVEDLDHPLDLLFPANHRIQLARTGAVRKVDAVAVQILALGGLVGLALPALVAASRILTAIGGSRRLSVAEETAEEGECGGLAVLAVVLLILLGDQALHGLRSAEGLHHLIGDSIQVVVGNAHTAHHIVDLRQAQVLGALEAQSLIDGFAVFNLRNIYHRHALFTSGTKGWLHSQLPPLQGREK